MRTLAPLALLLAFAGCGRSGPAAFEEARFGPVPVPEVSVPETPPPTPTPVPLCDPLDPTLLACFAFEESMADQSGAGRVAATASTAYTTGVGDGSALLLTATTAFVLPDAPELDPSGQTFEMWLRPDSLPAATTRMGVFDKDGQYGFFLQSDGSLTCTCPGAGVVPTAAGAITAGVWQHAACILDATAGQQIWIDGVLAGSGAAACGASTGASGVYLGENGTAGNDQFLGAMDRLRIWSDARTAIELCTEAGTCTD